MSEPTTPPSNAALAALGRLPEEAEARPDATVEEAVAKATPSRARLAQILTQGRVNARIQAIIDKVPSDRFAVFVRNNDSDIGHYEDMGFRVETGLKDVKGVHGSGDNRIIVGDVILMTTSQDNIAAIREIEEDMLQDKLDLPRKEYIKQAAANPGVAAFDETVKLR